MKNVFSRRDALVQKPKETDAQSSVSETQTHGSDGEKKSTTSPDLPAPSLDPLPSSLDPLPSSLDPLPSSLDPLPSSLDPLPSSLDPLPSSLDPLPSSLDPLPSSLDPLPSSLHPLPSSLHPLPSSLVSTRIPPKPAPRSIMSAEKVITHTHTLLSTWIPL